MNKDAPSAVTVTDSVINAQSTGTTSFIDNDTTSVGFARSALDMLSLGPPKFDANSIAEFLAKPTIIWSGAFPTSAAAGNNLYANQVGTALESNTLWMNKIEGYNLFRGTAHLKLTVNATPFHQGRLILHFLPNILLTDTDELLLHNNNLLQKSNHPNVTLDMRDTSAELIVPYITPATYYALPAHGGYRADWGTFFVDVLAPLVTGPSGLQSVDCTLFLYFSDVELSAPFIAESSAGGGRYRRDHTFINTTQSEEAKEASKGFLSKVVDTGKVVNNVLSNVPGWSIVSKPLDSILDAGSSILGAFGLSKPINLDKVTNVSTNPYRNMMNSSGVNNSSIMALNADAHLEVPSNFAGATVDEMSFNFLKGIPTYVGSFNITTVQPADTLVHTIRVNPSFQVIDQTTTGAVGVTETATFGPLGYLSQFFALWKGGITYTFKFIKTDFHSCRLLFTFLPCQEPTAVANNQESDYCLREIVDIRTDSEISITVPYMVPTPYLPIHDATGLQEYRTISGVLLVRILNPLRAPETCAAGFTTLVYSSAASDFEYAMVSNMATGVPFIPQGSQTAVDNYIANSRSTSVSSVHNTMVLGDRFDSIKQFFNILCPLKVSTDLTDDFGIYPFSYGTNKMLVASQSTLVRSGYGADYVTLLSLGYSLCRGGMRLMIPARSSSSTDMIVTALYPIGPSEPIVTTNETEWNVIPSLFTWPWAGGGAEFSPYSAAGLCSLLPPNIGQTDVTVPSGSVCALRRIRGFYFSPDVNSNPVHDFDQPRYKVHVSGNLAPQGVYRSGADDYVVGYFIGFPTIVRRVYHV